MRRPTILALGCFAAISGIAVGGAVAHESPLTDAIPNAEAASTSTPLQDTSAIEAREISCADLETEVTTCIKVTGVEDYATVGDREVQEAICRDVALMRDKPSCNSEFIARLPSTADVAAAEAGQ